MPSTLNQPDFKIENYGEDSDVAARWRDPLQKASIWQFKPDSSPIYWKSLPRRLVRLEWGTPKSSFDTLFDFQGILDFEGDPDDTEFVRCSSETVKRAKALLAPCVNLISSKPFIPTVSPGPAGSIDIHWKTPRKELLINIPTDRTSPARFYGDDYGNICIEGTLKGHGLAPVILGFLRDE